MVQHRDSLMRCFDLKFVTVPLGGLACFLRVPFSDLLPHRSTIQRISKSGAAAMDVQSSPNHIL